MASIRNAAVAGMFYPGDAAALAAELDELLGGIEKSAPRLGFPKALIVPHAGYIYSGPVAARAYDELGPARGIVRRAALEVARRFAQVVPSDAVHLHEHALEVQLPFLQRQLGDFTLAPFAVGMASVDEVAEVIDGLWGGPETLIVISTDLS